MISTGNASAYQVSDKEKFDLCQLCLSLLLKLKHHSILQKPPPLGNDPERCFSLH